jgi:hypothetical protein
MTGDREPAPEVAEVLYGVRDAGGESACPARLEDGITDPPTYIVQLTLVVGAAFTSYRRDEK